MAISATLDVALITLGVGSLSATSRLIRGLAWMDLVVGTGGVLVNAAQDDLLRNYGEDGRAFVTAYNFLSLGVGVANIGAAIRQGVVDPSPLNEAADVAAFSRQNEARIRADLGDDFTNALRPQAAALADILDATQRMRGELKMWLLRNGGDQATADLLANDLSPIFASKGWSYDVFSDALGQLLVGQGAGGPLIGRLAEWETSTLTAFRQFLDEVEGALAFCQNRVNGVGAWEVLKRKNLPDILTSDLDVMISYQNSSIASRVANWSDAEYLEHFTFLRSNPTSRPKFMAYLDDGNPVLADSGDELRAFLKIITNNPSSVPYSGNIYRSLSINAVDNFGAQPHIISDYSVQKAWGRYDLPEPVLGEGGGEGALYCSQTLSGNQTEITHYGNWQDFHTYEYTNVNLDNLLDLTNPVVRQEIGVDFELLTRTQFTGFENEIIDKEFNYEFTNVLGTWIRSRYNGVIVPGARGTQDYSNVILFEQSVVNSTLGTNIPMPIAK